MVSLPLLDGTKIVIEAISFVTIMNRVENE